MTAALELYLADLAEVQMGYHFRSRLGLDTFRARQPVDKYAHVASLKEIGDNDFNLNVPCYVDTFEEEEEIDVAAVEQEIERLERELTEVRARMKQYLRELGV